MIHVIAVIAAKPGKRDAILQAFRANVPAVQAEKGCLEYGAAVDAENALPFQTKWGPDIYLARCRWTRIYFLWRPNLRDESDNHLVELAVAGGAQAIVTRNKRDFRGAELRFENLAVLMPAECLRRTAWQP
jgi:hypothetical protein